MVHFEALPIAQYEAMSNKVSSQEWVHAATWEVQQVQGM